MDIKTLKVLKATTSDSPMPTLNISKIVVGKEGRKVDINPVLYELQKKGLAVKIAEENGSRPRWYITAQGIKFIKE